MSDYGIKTSKPFISVIGTKDDNTQYKSSSPALKIIRTVRASIVYPSGTGDILTVTAPHLLSYTPAYLPFVICEGIVYPIQATRISGAGVPFTADSYVDSTNVTFIIADSAANPASDVYFDFMAFIFTNRLF